MIQAAQNFVEKIRFLVDEVINYKGKGHLEDETEYLSSGAWLFDKNERWAVFSLKPCWADQVPFAWRVKEGVLN